MAKPTLDAEQVADYLRQHPDFLSDRPDLVAEIDIPHQNGEAVSLVERQVAILRERNLDMRHRLSKLLDTARDNDKLFDKTKRLVLALLEAQSLNEAVAALDDSLKNDFHVQYHQLILFGDPGDLAASGCRQSTLGEARAHLNNLLKSNRAICGVLRELEVDFLFGDQAAEIGSSAVVPLAWGNTFGVLAIGNRDPQHYRSSLGTLFLSYIGEVLNRVLPPLLKR